MDDARKEELLARLIEIQTTRAMRQPFPPPLIIADIMAELDLDYDEVMELRAYHAAKLAQQRAEARDAER